MTDQEILSTCTAILRDLLSDDSLVLTPATRRQDIPKWDSLAYINFMVALEMELGIKFNVGELEGFENVGAIIAAIKTKGR